jgi:hypothetical protein
VDVSQEPTGTIGVTIGYKRQEAVWMPLLANKAHGTTNEFIPAECASTATECPKFVGTAGTAGGAAGAGAQDTYSVLATFSGQVGGGTSGQGVDAKAGLAQYFATGLAARLLAQYGGAALVNANVQQNTSPQAISADVTQKVAAKRKDVATIGAKVSKTDGTIDSAKLTKLLTIAPASTITPLEQKILTSFQQRSALEDYLVDAPEATVDKLYKSIDGI